MLDSKDNEAFRILGLIAMIAWPVYFIWRMVSGNSDND